MSAAALALWVCLTAIHRKVEAEAPDLTGCVAFAHLAALGCGLFATLGLILLACLKTTAYPNLHAVSAYAFFGCMTLHVLLSTFVFASRGLPSHRLKLAVAALYSLAVIVYLPVGLAVVCPFVHLSLARCEGEAGLSPAYCGRHALGDGTLTEFWDYSACPAPNVMRSASQSVSVLLLLGFCLTYVADLAAGSGSMQAAAAAEEGVSLTGKDDGAGGAGGPAGV